MGFLSETTDLSAYLDKATYDADNDGMVDNLDVGALRASNFPKVVSTTPRNGHTNIVDIPVGDTSWTKYKTITFTNGIKGVLRITFELDDDTCIDAYAEVRKNGVLIGAEQSNNTSSYVLKSQDIDIGVVEAGETIELWGKNDGNGTAHLKEFRILYDNDFDPFIVCNSSNS